MNLHHNLICWFLTTWVALLPVKLFSIEPSNDCVLWHQDFEDGVPGEKAPGWSVDWGEVGDDVFTVTNQRVLSGKKAMLWDRQTGSNLAQYGIATVLPVVRDDWVKLTIPFLIQGAGNDVCFSFELRRPYTNDRILNFATQNREIFVKAADLTKKGFSLGLYEQDRWYRIIMWLPLDPGNERASQAVLEERNADGSWKAVGERQSIQGEVALNKGIQLMLVPFPGKRNFLIYMDDLCLERAVLSDLKRQD